MFTLAWRARFLRKIHCNFSPKGKKMKHPIFYSVEPLSNKPPSFSFPCNLTPFSALSMLATRHIINSIYRITMIIIFIIRDKTVLHPCISCQPSLVIFGVGRKWKNYSSIYNFSTKVRSPYKFLLTLQGICRSGSTYGKSTIKAVALSYRFRVGCAEKNNTNNRRTISRQFRFGITFSHRALNHGLFDRPFFPLWL